MTSNSPSIGQAQNSDRSIRLLAAQRRLYADAKLIHNVRISTVLAGGITGVVSAMVFPGQRSQIGLIFAVILFSISILGGAREKRKIKEASSVQEEFDTSIFNLPWNSAIGDRPANNLIMEAAARHKGGGLSDWYGDTGTLVHPLDVVVCQRSNLAWGISIHRMWASVAMWLGVALIAAGVGISIAQGLSLIEFLLATAAPLVPILKELSEIWRTGMESARGKEKADSKAAGIWESSLASGNLPKIEDCRGLQDRIYIIRQSNSFIPDWFYWMLRNRSETAMHASVSDYVAEAEQAGLA
ncbi:S-4TM family putative pore-forming effector [Kitasatospora sp. NBC_00240]|uniref:S-4TM family putative pore-forming effector n=1 Tax=Kitasatospora sp. NBC_00240 TaxID=2903567 RepID=UPI002252382E|nr:S-4TM family putative pore-forming effector [Kitasatospora sp. NBC_00240]MCX5213151.1 S-4TM family putative pore-forming effector [Kitasatospora sp. NBC_00240]